MWELKSIKCVECNKGGDLVSCQGNDCPVAVHQQCVASPIRFDENGKFYCPYCSYKRALRRELVLREKVSLEKQAFLKFINCQVGGGDIGADNGEGVSKSGDDDRGNEGLGGGYADGVAGEKCVQLVDDGRCSQEKRKEDDGLNVNDNDGKNCDDEVDRIENNIGDNEKDDCCGQEERIDDIDLHANEGDENICDKNEDEILEEEGHGQVDELEVDERVVEGEKQVETDVLLVQKDGSPKVDKSKNARRGKHVSPRILSPQRKISKEKSNEEKEVSKSKKPRESQKSPLKFKNLKFAAEKRKRFWKPEEEEMLKEGVQKFSSNVNKNIPWRNILVFGRHVFDSSRTPSDLKDKWKNMVAKGF